ncbi:MAG: hypothetical protein ABH889_03185, partial [Candidatus Portnoybacteria bacterium]
LSRSKFLGTQDSWKRIRVGDQVDLSVRRIPSGFRIIHQNLKQRIKDYLSSSENIGDYFFIWFCEDCDAIGHAFYGQDWLSNRETIESGHDKHAEYKKNCPRDNIFIFDHRGERRLEEEKLLFPNN